MHKGDKGKKASSDAAYQDSVTAPLGQAHDEDIMGLQDEDNEDEEPLREVLTAVEKVNPLLSV